MKLNKSDWKLVGHIGVDSGLCWIGDPCYILHKENGLPNSLGKTWDEFCDKVLGDSPTLKSFGYEENGKDGLGCAVATGYGDGYYSVYALVKNTGSWGERVLAVVVDFTGDLFKRGR